MKYYLRLFSLSVLLCLSGQVYATTEAYNTGWQLNIDNNIFKRYMKDRDYTGGIAYTATGSREQSGWLNIDLVRDWMFDDLPIIETE